MNTVFITAVAAQNAARTSMITSPYQRYVSEELPPLSLLTKIWIGIFLTIAATMVLGMFALVCDMATATETRVVKAVRLVGVEIDKGKTKHHQGVDYVLYRVQWPNDPSHSWLDEARSPTYCEVPAIMQVGTVKTVWYHERTTKFFHQVQRWTGGGQIFCNQ